MNKKDLNKNLKAMSLQQLIDWNRELDTIIEEYEDFTSRAYFFTGLYYRKNIDEHNFSKLFTHGNYTLDVSFSATASRANVYASVEVVENGSKTNFRVVRSLQNYVSNEINRRVHEEFSCFVDTVITGMFLSSRGNQLEFRPPVMYPEDRMVI